RNQAATKALRRYEAWQLQGISVEGRRGAACERSIACADQGIRELSGRVLPREERLFDSRLVLESHVHRAHEIRKRAEDLSLAELVAIAQNPLGLQEHEMANEHWRPSLGLSPN